jgi:hypothetical protein
VETEQRIDLAKEKGIKRTHERSDETKAEIAKKSLHNMGTILEIPGHTAQ